MTQVQQFYNHEAELAVLGAILFEPALIEKLAHLVAPDDFHLERNGTIFRAMCELADSGNVVDPVLLNEALSGEGGIDASENATFFRELVDNRAMAHNPTTYAEIVRERANRRRMYTTMQNALIDLKDDDDTSALMLRDKLTQRLEAAVRLGNGHMIRQTRWTAGALLGTDFPEPKWVIPDLLPAGLSFLGGKPKVGKSMLALQVAIAVGSGGRVLDRQVEAGRVLYLALEDSERRLKTRLQKQRAPGDCAITFELEWPTFGQGGLTKLQQALAGGAYAFVIIDTLSRAYGIADQLDVGQMTALTGELQSMTKSQDLSILVLDHHRKWANFESDPIGDILGSTAKGAVADVAMGLYKTRGTSDARLMITGRDMDDADLIVEFCPVTWCWQLRGDRDGVLKDSFEAEALEAVKALIALGELATVTNVAEFLDTNKGNVSRALSSLLEKGAIVKQPKEGRQQPYAPV